MKLYYKIKNPLIHKGTSQFERLLQTLAAGSFKIDGRSLKDLIVAAYRYAGLLHYYDETDQPDNDDKGWQFFWEIEALTLLAVLAELDIDALQRGYLELENEFARSIQEYEEPGAEGSSTDPAPAYYLKLIHYLHDIAQRTQRYFERLPEDHPLKKEFLALIRKDFRRDTEQLEDALQILISYHKAAAENLDPEQYKEFFHGYWGISDLDAYLCILPDDSYDREKLRALFLVFYRALKRIRRRANVWFERKLEAEQFHQPHIALFITFLYLFRHAQDFLNTLTQKHLDFYYERVLCLERRQEIPDEVHLIFELARDFNRHLIEKGTRLLAGKDKNGKPLIYEAVEDWVVNKTQVAEIKNIGIGLLESGKIYASADVRALGEETQTGAGQPHWRAFGDNGHLELEQGDDLEVGEMGFAVASPQLILQEGRREVHWQVDLKEEEDIQNAGTLIKGGSIEDISGGNFKMQVSTEEGWAGLEREASITLGDNQNVPTGFNSFMFGLDWIKFREFDAARRMASDFTADIGVYLDKPGANIDLKNIYDRQSGVKNTTLEHGVYHTAYRCIEGVNNELDAADSELITITDGIQGELLLLRAYCYWILAKTFAPPYDSSIADESTQLPKKYGDAGSHFSLQEIYDTIIGDLKQAKNKLVDTPPAGSFLDADRFVAAALLMRVYFQVGEHQATLDQCEEIIQNGGFELCPDPIDAFSKFDPATNKEVIWWLNRRAESPSATAGFDALSLLDREGKYSPSRTFALSEYFLKGSGWFDADLKVTDQARKDSRYQQLYQKIDAGHDPNYSYLDRPYVWCKKYQPQTDAKGEPDLKVPMIRYAEVLLTRAAIHLINNEETEALGIVNRLREKRGLAPLSGIDDEILARERMIELAFEGDRRDYLQAIQENIPGGDREGGPTDWDDDSLWFQPPDAPVRPSPASLGVSLGFRNLVFKLVLNPDFPAVLPPQKGDALAQASPWPALKVWIDPGKPGFAHIYAILRKAHIQKMAINTRVEGLSQSLIVQNELGAFDGTQSFMPFGVEPAVGNYFYIGSNEVFQKKIDELTIGFEWADPPGDFGEYYADYPGGTDSNGNLTPPNPKVSLFLLKDFDFDSNQMGADISLLNPNTMNLDSALLIETQQPPGFRVPQPRFFTQYTPALKNGFIKLKLANDDFWHDDYYQSLNPPYTPLVNSITISYNSSSPDILFGADYDGVEHFFHLLPFEGFKKIDMTQNFITLVDLMADPGPELKDFPKTGETVGYVVYTMTGDSLQNLEGLSITVDPQIFEDIVDIGFIGLNRIQAAIDGVGGEWENNKEVYLEVLERQFLPLAHGNLYLGLDNLQPGENISLLVQTMEGTEKNAYWKPPKLYWSYLARDNEWKPISKAQILSDSTYDLTRTGLIQLATPKDMARENTLLTPGLYWLRITATNNPFAEKVTAIAALPALIDIRAQGILARFRNNDNDLSHLGEPLPAVTISQLLFSRSAISKVEQPFESFGGKLPESGDEFYRRVSERLRHKGPAITIWDYERLLLEEFPKVYKAKCITHSDPETEIAPGRVSVAVIPNLRRRKGVLRAEPRFSYGDLEEMEAFLRAKANLFINADEDGLSLLNPVYEPILVRCTVVFREKVDPEFHKFKLDEELKGFLAPWLYDETAEISFEGVMKKSRLLQFIEERPYVDLVTEFKVFHAIEQDMLRADNKELFRVDQEDIYLTASRSVFTTFLRKPKSPSQTDHEIDYISREEFEKQK